MYNPRFPHTLVVKRQLFDEYGDPMTNDNGDALMEDVLLSVVDMFDNDPVKDENGEFVTHLESSLNFGYRTNSRSTSEAGDVIKADYKLATPMMVTPLKAGDKVVLTDYTRTFTCTVVKMTTYNIGTNIWVDEVHN